MATASVDAFGVSITLTTAERKQVDTGLAIVEIISGVVAALVPGLVFKGLCAVLTALWKIDQTLLDGDDIGFGITLYVPFVAIAAANPFMISFTGNPDPNAVPGGGSHGGSSPIQQKVVSLGVDAGPNGTTLQPQLRGYSLNLVSPGSDYALEYRLIPGAAFERLQLLAGPEGSWQPLAPEELTTFPDRVTNSSLPDDIKRLAIALLAQGLGPRSSQDMDPDGPHNPPDAPGTVGAKPPTGEA